MEDFATIIPTSQMTTHVKECGESGNRGDTFRQEMELLMNQLRHAHKSKDDRKQTKTTEYERVWTGGHL